MQISVRRLINPFITPLIIFVLATAATLKWGNITQLEQPAAELSAFLIIFPLVPYLLFTIIILLGLRSNNSGIIFVSILLVFSYSAIFRFAASAPTLIKMIAFLLPINIFLWGSIRKTTIFSQRGIFLLILLGIEMLIVFYICYFHDLPQVKFNFEMYREFPNFSHHLDIFMQNLENFLSFRFLTADFPLYLLLVVSIAANFIAYYHREDVFFAVYIILCILSFIGAASSSYLPSATIYFTACGLILIISTIEASFSMAYIDELTALPGRRSLTEAMSNLPKKYSIAMIDIDHFKKFNDTYGHKTGDQVLRMVAFKLGEISGGAKVFRYGGEEFTAIFPGKTAREAVPYLEEFRQTIETSPFTVRTGKRTRTSSELRGRKRSDDEKKVSLTISIGVASSNKNLNKPEKVIKTADKILYKAKNAGRNVVKSI